MRESVQASAVESLGGAKRSAWGRQELLGRASAAHAAKDGRFGETSLPCWGLSATAQCTS